MENEDDQFLVELDDLFSRGAPYEHVIKGHVLNFFSGVLKDLLEVIEVLSFYGRPFGIYLLLESVQVVKVQSINNIPVIVPQNEEQVLSRCDVGIPHLH